MMPATPDPIAEMTELSTLRDVLRYAISLMNAAGVYHGHGASSAVDEAAFLILETLNLPVDDFNAFADARLTARERNLLGERLAQRVQKRMPSAYLAGRTYLHGYSFRSDPRAIIPRSFIADLLASPAFSGDREDGSLIGPRDEIRQVLDLCTGGGSLAILAAHHFPDAEITAVDLSGDALALAAENVGDYGLEERIALVRSDLFAGLKGKRFDLILTNPPYVDDETMAMLPEEFRHEPTMALAGGADGFDLVRKILAGARAHLTAQGGILCEIGTDRSLLEASMALPFLWLDTEESEGEVFWLTAKDLP